MDDLVYDFGNGVDALARAERSIIMMIDAAIGRLLLLGYDRDRDGIRISIDPSDQFPVGLELGGKRVFEVNMGPVHSGDTMTVAIIGNWLVQPKKRSWWRSLKFWG